MKTNRQGSFARLFDWPKGLKGPVVIGLGLLMALTQLVLLFEFGSISGWLIGGSIGCLGYGLVHLFWFMDDGPSGRQPTNEELPSADEYEQAFREIDE